MLKNITFSAEEELIKRAREKAQADKTTLNNAFKRWLKQYADPKKENEIDVIMEKMVML